MKPITGWHIFGLFVLGFGTIIAVNLTLAFNAVRTFPGLEVKNSYVASQSFEADRAAQNALNWTVSAHVFDGELVLSFDQDGIKVEPSIENAIFGRATSVIQDQLPEFAFDGHVFSAPVNAGAGNWNLRIRARAADGTLFQQRIIVEVLG
ncbi:MAG: nitrogen fixation protein FixH [Boseongicola sp.]|nr:MAG: nitrogen fixation protein FixH [Boseongicola sp.]